MSNNCTVCQSETDAYLCVGCLTEIVEALNDLPRDIDDLEAVMTRQATGPMGFGDPHRTWRAEQAEPSELPAWLRSSQGPIALPETPWPFAPGAADLRWGVDNTINTWVRHLLETRDSRAPEGPTCRRCTHPSCIVIRRDDARLLLIEYANTIRLDEAAAQIHDEITWLHRAINHAILGVSGAETYLGVCDLPDVRVEMVDGRLQPRVATCGAHLYAFGTDTYAVCRLCGASYYVPYRKQEMAKLADDQWARAHVIANGLTSLDEPITPATLRKWIERGHIQQVATDDDDHPLYRVGDVRARIAEMRSRRALSASA